MVERSSDWFKQAVRDLEAANKMLEDGFYEWTCFLSQQSAEKAVKAVLLKQGHEPFGHSVTGLLKGLSRYVDVPQELIEYAKELDKAYIPTIYPNALPEGPPYQYYTYGEAKRLIENGRKILEFCKNILSKI